ncbi:MULTISPECIES: rRNA maturation RNase YbeY [Priestia]|jgi:probable rRNA maturation factor|uniref:Endoribonuclease YbeY n=2 Tax=Priestia TaxID=2800373 RepID=D5DSF7_PRIM1|nr:MULTISPECIES: rRNA maturation RNase YbeY [Priestia]AVX10433.1 rRNA maturation RNase YbeY [Bacillus sp. Y-01]KOP76515.1 rRNA maturation factor [Bacillus sp. FJAT-21351]KQU14547.1 rRNA maturation factor [Bacillus sp. Leaf75]MBZ5477951.1 rRNA maturation RNase YbeY [Bacillus sp. T_4]MCJ7984538.1 rRNA maturation RNase YbeY [Priestia sp. OVL9]MDP9577476.1 putative rRNA maturation factor [Bacillus sp. 1751]MEB2273250.1 rRNA maturation RNase YbeY [Bacillus sp. ILBB4]
MSLVIDFIDETNEVSEEQQKELEKLLEAAAIYENLQENAEVSVTFVDNDRIQEINHQYRHKNQPTDVISFALEEMGEDEMQIIGDELPRVLGDIVISIPKAHEQAEEYNHSFMRELGFLTVHGFLHLLGYDHETSEDEKEMFTRQKDILEQYGLSR